jgi:hypothetical protein
MVVAVQSCIPAVAIATLFTITALFAITAVVGGSAAGALVVDVATLTARWPAAVAFVAARLVCASTVS